MKQSNRVFNHCKLLFPSLKARKKEALLQRLIERHGEDEAELEELMDACVAEEDEDA